jgi:hypothetical protein
MARLTPVECMQLTAVSVKDAQGVVRWPVRPMAEYVAFATFAARFAPTTVFKPITQGRHWKL